MIILCLAGQITTSLWSFQIYVYLWQGNKLDAIQNWIRILFLFIHRNLILLRGTFVYRLVNYCKIFMNVFHVLVVYHVLHALQVWNQFMTKFMTGEVICEIFIKFKCYEFLDIATILTTILCSELKEVN